MQRSGAPAALPADPALSATESAHREERIGRKKELEGQDSSRESSQGSCRRRRGKTIGPEVGVVPSAKRSSGEEEAGSGSAKARRGNEIRARIAQVGFMVGVGLNFIKCKELFFESDVGQLILELRLRDHASVGIIEIHPPRGVATNPLGRRPVTGRDERDRARNVSFANAHAWAKGKGRGAEERAGADVG